MHLMSVVYSRSPAYDVKIAAAKAVKDVAKLAQYDCEATNVYWLGGGRSDGKNGAVSILSGGVKRKRDETGASTSASGSLKPMRTNV